MKAIFAVGLLLALGMSQANASEFLGGTLVSRSQGTEIGLVCDKMDSVKGCTELSVLKREKGKGDFKAVQKFYIAQVSKEEFDRTARKAARDSLNENYLGAGFAATGLLILVGGAGMADHNADAVAIALLLAPVGIAIDIAKAPLVGLAYLAHLGVDRAGAKRFVRNFEFLSKPEFSGQRQTVSNRTLTGVLAGLGIMQN